MANEHKKRTYRSPARLEGAQGTSREILAAAERLFGSQGYAAVTMKAIADAAGVSPATVYLHFSGKGSIVRALASAITDSPDLSVERVEDGGPAEQVRVGVSILRQLNERSWVVAEILRAYSGVDPELKALAGEWQQRHLDAVTRGVGAVAEAGLLRPGLTAERAADLLYAVGGTDVFRELVRERGWSSEEYELWLADFVAENFVAPRE